MTTLQNAPNGLTMTAFKIMPLKPGRQAHLDPMSLDKKYSNIMYSPANRPHDMMISADCSWCGRNVIVRI